MFVSLCDELVLISYQELDFQFDKDSRRSTFGYVYIKKKERIITSFIPKPTL